MPRSAAISLVSSTGKPNVSCSLKVVSPDSDITLGDRIELGFEQGVTGPQGLTEAPFFTSHNIGDEVLLILQFRIPGRHDIHGGLHELGRDETFATQPPGVPDGPAGGCGAAHIRAHRSREPPHRR